MHVNLNLNVNLNQGSNTSYEEGEMNQFGLDYYLGQELEGSKILFFDEGK